MLTINRNPKDGSYSIKAELRDDSGNVIFSFSGVFVKVGDFVENLDANGGDESTVTIKFKNEK